MNYIQELSVGDNPLIQEGDCQWVNVIHIME
jgi:hypothetical protein